MLNRLKSLLPVYGVHLAEKFARQFRKSYIYAMPFSEHTFYISGAGRGKVEVYTLVSAKKHQLNRGVLHEHTIFHYGETFLDSEFYDEKKPKKKKRKEKKKKKWGMIKTAIIVVDDNCSVVFAFYDHVSLYVIRIYCVRYLFSLVNIICTPPPPPPRTLFSSFPILRSSRSFLVEIFMIGNFHKTNVPNGVGWHKISYFAFADSSKLRKYYQCSNDWRRWNTCDRSGYMGREWRQRPLPERKIESIKNSEDLPYLQQACQSRGEFHRILEQPRKP